MGDPPTPINDTPPMEPPAPDSPARPVLTINWARYQKMLEESDINDAEKQEFLETLWNIIVAFVDLGYGIHPLQQACEQKQQFSAFDPVDVVSLSASKQTKEQDKQRSHDAR